jgi:iron complex transport system substrate-binding protein
LSFARPAAAALLAAALLAACGSDAAPGPRSNAAVQAADHAGDTLRLPAPARRIVSLVPSVTETLIAIGAGDRLVARTDYDRGPGLDTLPSLGGGLDPSLEALVALRPDLVVGWDASGANPLRQRLAALGIPFFPVRLTDTTDVFRAFGALGALTGRAAAADSVAAEVRAEIRAVRASVAGRPPRSVFFLVSDDPPMTAGPRTFIVQLIHAAGGRSVFDDAPGDWPQVSLEELVRRQPDVVLLPAWEGSGDRARALAARPGWRELSAAREGRIRTLPADEVNRPGPGIGRTARLLRDAIHPPDDER